MSEGEQIPEGVRCEVIKHISAEITTHAEFLNTLRSRMGFTVLVGPFLVLGSVLIGTKSLPTSLAWPPTHMWQWALLALAFTCYLGLGWYGGRIDKNVTKICNGWRSTLLPLASGQSVLQQQSLEFPLRDIVGAYLLGYALGLGAFLGMTAFLLSMLSSS